MYIRFILINFIIITVQVSLAQEFEVPKNYTLKTKEDYPRYNTDVVNCVTWLEKTPLTEQSDKRVEALTFLEKWVMGSPVNFPYDPNLLPPSFTNCELTIDFMGGWVRDIIQHGNKIDTVRGTLAGFRTAFKIYKANKILFKRDKLLNYFINLDENGTLEKWFHDNLISH